MTPQLEKIKTKLEQLKVIDKEYKLFGSPKHKHQLNPCLSAEGVKEFEKKHGVTLPDDYAAFLMNIGNGGAGPAYGLEPLENCLFADLDYKRPEFLLKPGQPFPHTEAWNLEFRPTAAGEEDEEKYEKEFSEFRERYFRDNELSGLIAISNYGCGIRFNLIVNGSEYGHVWIDDRANYTGVYPFSAPKSEERVTFLSWYELWLTKALKEVKRRYKTK